MNVPTVLPDSNRINSLFIDWGSVEAKKLFKLLSGTEPKLNFSCCDELELAQDSLMDNDYDLCFIDFVHNPELSLDFIHYVRENHFRLPIILIIRPGANQLEQRAISAGASDVVDADGTDCDGVERLIRRVVKRWQIEDHLFREKEKLEITLDSITDGVVGVTADGRVNYMNIVAETITGLKLDKAQGSRLFDGINIVDEVTEQSLNIDILRRMAHQESFKLGPDALLIKDSGECFNVECFFSPIYKGQEDITGYVIVIHDVTEVHQWSQKLMFEASHDSLTGLVNRAEFEARLQQAIKIAEELNTEHVLCYLDLDQFKIVNDTCGHAAGDELLRQLTTVLHTVVRKRDTLARLGGDEFGILLWQCDVQHGEKVAQQVLKKIGEFRFSWTGKSFTVGASIGVVGISETSASWVDSLSLADSACYEAKENGRNRVHVVQPNDTQIIKRQGEMQWVTRIVNAVEGEGFCLYQQEIKPVYNDNTESKNEANAHSKNDIQDKNAGLHCEILLRYQDEQGDMYPPGAFLPAAERYGVIKLVDRWVVRNALQWLGDNVEQLRRMSLCSINLSGTTLSDITTVDYIRELIEQTQVDANKLCFEVTETAAVTNLVDACEFISKLREIGCKFALDDFGAGMSSFSYLKHMPVDFVKIDGSFVRNIVDDEIDYAMVKSINDISHIMGKKTIAELCESKEVYEKLKEIGVDYVQGFYLGKPIPLS
ncbi:MAG: EAL domain-containing protein [Pseudomonadales bacterium]|nr:EAL domain-containing protein [Pseudomonadales bacterium]